MSTEQALLRIKNAQKELSEAERELRMEQDKNKIHWYDGMPVFVRSGPGENWNKRFLKQHNCNGYDCYYDGRIPGLEEGRPIGTTNWKECKPNYEQSSILFWIPNTGVIPKGVKKAIIKYRIGGNTPTIGDNTDPKAYSWHIGGVNPILAYAIIEKEIV